MSNELSQIINKQQISAHELSFLIKNYTVMVLDVRHPEEYTNYHLENSINLPIDNLNDETFKAYATTKDAKPLVVVTYCNSGGRGGRAFNLLQRMNDNPNIIIKHLHSGINQWINYGYPIIEHK